MCPWGKCPGGTMSGGGVCPVTMEVIHTYNEMSDRVINSGFVFFTISQIYRVSL